MLILAYSALFRTSGQVGVDEVIAFLQDPVARMRRRLKAALLSKGGDDWALLVRGCPPRQPMSWEQFHAWCHTELSTLDDDLQLVIVFRQIDACDTGRIAPEEFLAFLATGVVGTGKQAIEQSERRQPSYDPAVSCTRLLSAEEGAWSSLHTPRGGQLPPWPPPTPRAALGSCRTPARRPQAGLIGGAFTDVLVISMGSLLRM